MHVEMKVLARHSVEEYFRDIALLRLNAIRVLHLSSMLRVREVAPAFVLTRVAQRHATALRAHAAIGRGAAA